MIEMIEIPKMEYFNLRQDSEKLSRLEQGGVENWNWYGDSVHGSDKQDWDEFVEELREEIYPHIKTNRGA